MRRPLISFLSALAVLLGTMLVSAPAQAASKPVSITSVTSQWVGWSGTAKHSPSVKKNKKKASIKSKTISVYSYSAKKTIASNKKSVNLKAGKYKISAKSKYKYKGKTRTIKKTYVVNVKQGNCAVRSDAAKLVTDTLEGSVPDGDSIETVQAKLRSKGVVVLSATLRELLEDTREDPSSTQADIDEAVELLENLSPAELDSEALQWRDFLACGYKRGFGIDAIFIVVDGKSSLVIYTTPDDF